MRILIAAALLGLGLTACSVEFQVGESEGSNLSQSDLDKQLADEVTPDDENATLETSCEGGIEAGSGQAQYCEVTVDGNSTPVRVRASGEDNLRFQPYLQQDQVPEYVAQVVSQVNNVQLADVSCDGPLPVRTGETVGCTGDIEGGASDVAMDVEVTEVDGLRFQLNVAER